MGNIFHGCSFR